MEARTVEMPQNMLALDYANEIRLGIAHVKRQLRAGELTVERALYRPEAQKMRILDLVAAPHRWGNKRAAKLLTQVGVLPPSHFRRVRFLTERQKRAIIEALD